MSRSDNEFICNKTGSAFLDIIRKEVEIDLLVKISPYQQAYISCFMNMTEDRNKRDIKINLEKFARLLPALTVQYDITLQQGRRSFFDIKKIDDRYLSYEFYMSPDDLHRLLLETSPDYIDYRSGESIETVAHPERSAIQMLAGDTMYLFPVLDEGSIGSSTHEDIPHDLSLLIRNGGCNTGEVLSYQLSLWLQEHMPEICGDALPYGHYSSPIVQDLEIYPEDLIMAAYSCVGLGGSLEAHEMINYINPQNHDGMAPLHLKSSHYGFFKKMEGNEKALFAYKQSAVTPSELIHLSSLEVPKLHYMDCLIAIILEKKTRFPGGATERTLSILTALREKIQAQEDVRRAMP